MERSDDRKSRRARVARAAAERLASGRAREIDEAVERAARDLRLGARDARPTRKELRAHAQALEESLVGADGHRRRLVEALDEVIAVLEALAPFSSADPDGNELPPPTAYGRAARGEFDLDPSAHLRVVTATRIGVLADHLERSGFVSDEGSGVDCGALETRYGMMDELRFEGARVRFRIVRVPPRMPVDPDRDLLRGRRVERAGVERLRRRRAELERSLATADDVSEPEQG